MASNDNKLFYDEKNDSPVASTSDEPVVAGQVSKLKRRLPGFSLAVPHEESSFAASSSDSNADFDPIPPSKRTWNWGAYVAYWMADAWAVSNWEVGEYYTPRDVPCLWSLEKRSGAETLAIQRLL
jgi:nucleobase:cation symporter-1, NCS1 family